MARGVQRSLLVLVVAAACLPYLSTINNYFLQDDFGVVQLLVNRPWTTFPRWFTMPWMENIWAYTPDEIRPFVAFTYQLTGKWTPTSPELHHALNIAIHAANAVLVMALARAAIGLSPYGAAFAGVLFALLPVQAESVAWITGRVDSMPAFFYLATFLAYVRWRAHRRWSAYAWALALFFVALFSKQNTITMVGTLAAYDLLALDKPRRGTLVATVAAWMPFAAMTIGYLLLRRALFGHSVRGGLDNPQAIQTFVDTANRHFSRVSLGHTSPLTGWEIAAAITVVLLALAAAWRNARFVRLALCFGVIWWAIGVAPTAVAGYESPRHVYLASAGWAFFLALLFDRLQTVLHRVAPWPVLHRVARWLPLAAAAVIAAVYLGRLIPVVNEWETLAGISRAGGQRVAEEARSAPEGTLLLVRLPKKSWEWSAPFSMGPPFVESGLTDRVRLVTPQPLHCCGEAHWNTYTRQHLQAWLDAPGRPPLVALYFADNTGALARLTDAEYPDLRAFVRVLAETDSAATLNGSLVDLMERLVRR